MLNLLRCPNLPVSSLLSLRSAGVQWLRINRSIIQAVIFGLASFGLQAAPQYQAHVAYLQGEGDVQGIKLALQRSTEFGQPTLQQLGIGGQLQFEFSANFWRYQPNNQTDQNLVLALSPVWTKHIGALLQRPLDIEFGIGVSLLDDTQFAGKNVSTHYQFEDRLGLQWHLSTAHSVYLRYMHYSNGGVKKPNPGLDFIAVGYSQRF